MTGEELRQRINRLGLSYIEAASRLGLTTGGLHHQMRGERPVGRQTELLLQRLEDDHWRTRSENPANLAADPRFRRVIEKTRASPKER